MTHSLDRVSIWKDRNSPVYDIGDGALTIKHSYAKVRVNISNYRSAGAPDDVENWSIVATRDGDLIYEGMVDSTIGLHSMSSKVMLKCKPAALPP